MLEQFATRGVNLSLLESRPIGDALGRYRFVVDLDGHVLDERVADALLGLKRFSPNVIFLGSYPRADRVAVTVIVALRRRGLHRRARLAARPHLGRTGLTMAKKSAPDPRFDPRFQRGYDGPQPDAPPTPAVPSPIEPATPSRPQATGSGSRSRDASRRRTPAGRRSRRDAARRRRALVAAAPQSLRHRAAGRRRRDDRRRPLAGLDRRRGSRRYPDGNDQRGTGVRPAFSSRSTPALLIAGLLGIVGWLVLGRARRIRSKGRVMRWRLIVLGCLAVALAIGWRGVRERGRRPVIPRRSRSSRDAQENQPTQAQMDRVDSAVSAVVTASTPAPDAAGRRVADQRAGDPGRARAAVAAARSRRGIRRAARDRLRARRPARSATPDPPGRRRRAPGRSRRRRARSPRRDRVAR